MVNYFLSLSLSQALGVFIFGAILLGSLVVMFTDWCVKQVVQHRIAGVDVFADQDDPTAVAPFDPSHVSRLFLRSDDEFRRIDLKSFTCTSCSKQERCPFAYDLYCTDGDCLDK